MITLDAARTMVEAARAKGREMGLKPLSVAVLDAGGHLLAFEREDGASPGRFEIARGKAYGAVMLGMPGSAQMANSPSSGPTCSMPSRVKTSWRSMVGTAGISGSVPSYVSFWLQ